MITLPNANLVRASVENLGARRSRRTKFHLRVGPPAGADRGVLRRAPSRSGGKPQGAAGQLRRRGERSHRALAEHPRPVLLRRGHDPRGDAFAARAMLQVLRLRTEHLVAPGAPPLAAPTEGATPERERRWLRVPAIRSYTLPWVTKSRKRIRPARTTHSKPREPKRLRTSFSASRKPTTRTKAKRSRRTPPRYPSAATFPRLSTQRLLGIRSTFWKVPSRVNSPLIEAFC